MVDRPPGASSSRPSTSTRSPAEMYPAPPAVKGTSMATACMSVGYGDRGAPQRDEHQVGVDQLGAVGDGDPDRPAGQLGGRADGAGADVVGVDLGHLETPVGDGRVGRRARRQVLGGDDDGDLRRGGLGPSPSPEDEDEGAQDDGDDAVAQQEVMVRRLMISLSERSAQEDGGAALGGGTATSAAPSSTPRAWSSGGTTPRSTGLTASVTPSPPRRRRARGARLRGARRRAAPGPRRGPNWGCRWRTGAAGRSTSTAARRRDRPGRWPPGSTGGAVDPRGRQAQQGELTQRPAGDGAARAAGPHGHDGGGRGRGDADRRRFDPGSTGDGGQGGGAPSGSTTSGRLKAELTRAGPTHQATVGARVATSWADRADESDRSEGDLGRLDHGEAHGHGRHAGHAEVEGDVDGDPVTGGRGRRPGASCTR